MEPLLSHTALLPLPNGFDTSICKSGSEVKLVWYADVPTAAPDSPGIPSTTSEKPLALGRE